MPVNADEASGRWCDGGRSSLQYRVHSALISIRYHKMHDARAAPSDPTRTVVREVQERQPLDAREIGQRAGELVAPAEVKDLHQRSIRCRATRRASDVSGHCVSASTCSLSHPIAHAPSTSTLTHSRHTCAHPNSLNFLAKLPVNWFPVSLISLRCGWWVRSGSSPLKLLPLRSSCDHGDGMEHVWC